MTNCQLPPWPLRDFAPAPNSNPHTTHDNPMNTQTLNRRTPALPSQPFFLPMKTKLLLPILTLLVLLLGASSASADTHTSVGSGNWSTAGTWNSSGGGVPTASDTVNIAPTHTVTVDTSGAGCTTLQIGNASGMATLKFNSGSILAVSGTVTLGQSSGGNNRFGTIDMTSGGTLKASGLAVYNSTSDVWTPGTGTVELTANNNLPTKFSSFNNLTISGGTTTLAANLTIGRNLEIGTTASMALGSYTTSTANTLSFGGSQQGPGAWGPNASTAVNKSPRFGTGNNAGRMTVSLGGLHHFAISTITSPKTVGTAFTITTITAQDVANTTVTSFGGTVTFGGSAGVTGTSGTFTLGVLNNASVTPTAAGSSLTVAVTDGSSHTGSATITTVNKGSSTVTVTGTTSFTYSGSGQGPGTADVTGSTGAKTYSYAGTGSTTYLASANKPTAAGTYAVTATVAADDNYNGAASSPATAFTIGKATAVVSVSGYTGTYDAAAHGASGAATGVGAANLNSSLNLGATYTDYPGGTANWTFSNPNYSDQSGSVTITINKASSTTVVTISGGPFTYTGSALTPASVSVTGAGGLSLTPTATYANNVNAGTATASYSFAGDANHTGSSGSQTFSIGQASSTTVVTITGAPFTYTGAAITPATVSVTGAGGLYETPTATYANNGNAGTATASYTYAGDANHTGSTDSKTFSIGKATPTATLAVNNSPQTYNGSAKAAVVVISVSSPAGGSVANILTGGAASQTAAGTYAVTADYVPADTANYNTLSAHAAGNFVINKASSGKISTVVPQQNGDVKVVAFALPNRSYTLETSPDLIEWLPVATITAPLSGVINYLDTTAGGASPRFYRLLLN